MQAHVSCAADKAGGLAGAGLEGGVAPGESCDLLGVLKAAGVANLSQPGDCGDLADSGDGAEEAEQLRAGDGGGAGGPVARADEIASCYKGSVGLRGGGVVLIEEGLDNIADGRGEASGADAGHVGDVTRDKSVGDAAANV